MDAFSARDLSIHFASYGREGGSTDLRPDHLRQCSYELRCCVYAEIERFFIYNFADGEPEGGF